jgi:hypothetical protein
MINHPDLPFTVYQMSSIFTKAYVKAATSGNALKSFEVTRKCAFNKDVYLFAFLPSTMEQMFFPEETTVHITKVNYL